MGRAINGTKAHQSASEKRHKIHSTLHCMEIFAGSESWIFLFAMKGLSIHSDWTLGIDNSCSQTKLPAREYGDCHPLHCVSNSPGPNMYFLSSAGQGNGRSDKKSFHFTARYIFFSFSSLDLCHRKKKKVSPALYILQSPLSLRHNILCRFLDEFPQGLELDTQYSISKVRSVKMLELSFSQLNNSSLSRRVAWRTALFQLFPTLRGIRNYEKRARRTLSVQLKWFAESE